MLNINQLTALVGSNKRLEHSDQVIIEATTKLLTSSGIIDFQDHEELAGFIQSSCIESNPKSIDMAFFIITDVYDFATDYVIDVYTESLIDPLYRFDDDNYKLDLINRHFALITVLNLNVLEPFSVKLLSQMLGVLVAKEECHSRINDLIEFENQSMKHLH